MRKIKIKKKFKILLSTAILLLIVILLFIKFLKPITYKITGDFTSSGAGRKYEAILTFKNNLLISGYQLYDVGEGGGCKSNCEHKIKCNVLNNIWIDSENSGQCSLNYIDNNLNSLKSKIKYGEIKPIKDCGHAELCYNIIK